VGRGLMPTQPAALGTARLNNFRLNYFSSALAPVRETRVRILINGVESRHRVRYNSLTIRDIINDTPNTCGFLIETPAPAGGDTVRITINSDTPQLLFNGAVQTVDLAYEGRPTQNVWRITAIDDTEKLNRIRPFGAWTTVSATTLAQILITTFAPGFTTQHVQAGLESVSVNLDSTEGFSGALRQIAKLIGGYFYVEDMDLHLFTEETTEPPDPIDAAHPPLNDPAITLSTDYSQLRTRVYGKGGGSTTQEQIPIGATTIPVMSTAFFEASGGMVVASSGTQRITYTGIGTHFVASDRWQTQTPPSDRAWRAVAWSPTLGLFAAVGSDGTAAQQVMTSPDGITWTARTAANTVQWYAITWAAGLGLFVALAYNGTTAQQVMTSPDGITWTPRTSANAVQWRSVVWAPALGLLVAVADSGTATQQVMTSPDGITWTARTAAATATWQGVTWSPALGRLVAVNNASGSAATAMTSPDGITWTIRTLPTSNGFLAVTWSPERALFVAVGQFVMTSPDGITWTLRTSAIPSTLSSVLWAATVDTTGRFVAFAFDNTAPRQVMTSPDGIKWTAGDASGVGWVWKGVWAPEIGVMVAVGIPTTGVTATVMKNPVTVETAGALIGIPASGAGAIVAAIPSGDPINIWVQRDDLAAQALYGLFEYVITDERRATASLVARCDAELALYANPIQTVPYATRDVKTRSGKTVTINLSSPSINTTLVLQNVTITQIDIADGLAPRFTATASTVRFSLEDVLRRAAAEQDT
jgi:hypothetical protein